MLVAVATNIIGYTVGYIWRHQNMVDSTDREYGALFILIIILF